MISTSPSPLAHLWVNTTRQRAAVVLAPLLLLGLAGCGSGGGSMAMVMCEDFVDRRVGAELEHKGPMDGATVAGEGPTYVVKSAFVEPLTKRTTSYTCTITELGDGKWRLDDLQTSR